MSRHKLQRCTCPWWCYVHPPYASLRGLAPAQLLQRFRAAIAPERRQP